MNAFEFKNSLKQIGISQGDFAELCGVHHTTVNRWCNGGIRIPKYAKALLTMEYEGIDIERKIRKLVDEGRLFNGINVENCPSYSEVFKLIRKIKAIEN